MHRRKFLAATAFSALATSAMADDDKKSSSRSGSTSTTTAVVPASTTVKARVIVIGGGMAGTTVAKYLRLWGDGIEVTLVERMPTYTSNIMSSLVLTGQRTMASLTYNYDTLRSKYGVTTVFGEVVAIDPVAAKVTLANKTVLTADRIVMAPGISFDTVPGLGTSDKMPHAWTSRPANHFAGQSVEGQCASKEWSVLTIPKTPYRCPPGPYERACLIADWLKVKKPGSKLIVLDANPGIVTEVDNFTNAFMGLHGNVIEYHANAEVTSVDPASHVALSPRPGHDPRRCHQHDSAPARRIPGATAGLNNATEGRFAGVNVLSYASTVSGASKVHIIGDSSATTQPKAGHMPTRRPRYALTRSAASCPAVRPTRRR
jgi:sulfide dehydrogenase [flavocytochrome c] flavoprotein subunit